MSRPRAEAPWAIRPVHAGEAEAARALMHAAHAWNMANGFNFTAGFISVEELLPRLAPASFFVAAEGLRLLGTIEVLPEPEPGRWGFHLLAVAPAAAGRGVGRALVAHAEAVAAEAGGRELILDTPENHPWLPAFYTRLGYEPFGTTHWEGKLYRSVLMRKPLN